jgi:hypothetical protein
MSGKILKILHQLSYHLFGSWSLLRWIVTLAWGAAIFVLAGWQVRGRPPVSVGHWLVLALIFLVGLTLLLAGGWARRQFFVAFDRDGNIDPPLGEALPPTDKVLIHATGHFTVSNKTQHFTHLLAYWRTFASREHAIMAIIHDTRYLLISGTPEEHVGMWYIFFKAEMLLEIAAGQLTFGAADSPALRVAYKYTPPLPQDGKKRRRKPKPVRREIYLAFENSEDRLRVWADLLAAEGQTDF